jgi:hypothetical protein
MTIQESTLALLLRPEGLEFAEQSDEVRTAMHQVAGRVKGFRVYSVPSARFPNSSVWHARAV